MKTYLIVDGYNVIHHIAEKEGLVDFNLEEARENLIERLNSFSGLMGYETVLVFDAYSQEKRKRSEEIRGRVKVVFTEKNKTADSYIEKLVFELPKLYTVKVVTSDYTLQRVVMAAGGERIPSRELLNEMDEASKEAGQRYHKPTLSEGNKLSDYMDDEVLAVMKALRKGNVEE